MSYYSIQQNQYNFTPPPTPKKYIGKYITNTNNLQSILDKYYTKYMNNKLKLYDDNMLELMNKCLTRNIQLFNLFSIIVKPRTFTNRFRKNNTLNYLIQLYNMIRDMLVNYDIQTTFDLNNYSCFHMLVHVSYILKTDYVHLQKYFQSDGNLIDLFLEIRQNILMIAFAFLNKIYSSYEANYSVMLRKINNISRSKNFTSTNPISSPILNVSQRNNEQKYDAVINLYIQFLSMYNKLILFIDTFQQYTTSTGNLTTTFIEEIEKMFNEISEKNKLLFKEYIKYLGRVEIGNSVGTGFPNPNVNSLVKGLYHQGEVW